MAEHIAFAQNPGDALRGAHAAAIVTDWDEYRRLNWAEVKDRMETPVLLDGRNMLDRAEMRRLGFAFMAVGR
ncbi:UDP binding domain-containing protein [Cohnella hongkongensis]|uniref:UDP binding domain-containing protein n=1 Tax=Cohnella hongkongensis TaxID=178337 RepID=A0ABV9FAM4_9BACL